MGASHQNGQASANLWWLGGVVASRLSQMEGKTRPASRAGLLIGCSSGEAKGEEAAMHKSDIDPDRRLATSDGCKESSELMRRLFRQVAKSRAFSTGKHLTVEARR